MRRYKSTKRIEKLAELRKASQSNLIYGYYSGLIEMLYKMNRLAELEKENEELKEKLEEYKIVWRY